MNFKQFDKGIPMEKIDRMIDERRRKERIQEDAKREREQAEMLEIARFLCAVETAKANNPEFLKEIPPPYGVLSLDRLND